MVIPDQALDLAIGKAALIIVGALTFIGTLLRFAVTASLENSGKIDQHPPHPSE